MKYNFALFLESNFLTGVSLFLLLTITIELQFLQKIYSLQANNFNIISCFGD